MSSYFLCCADAAADLVTHGLDALNSATSQSVRIEYAGSKRLTLETGEIGRLAAGSVMLTAGDTMIYTNVCASPQVMDADFTPLQVAYHERLSAAGRTAYVVAHSARLQ
jgi:hypothetical protein